jgi:hypothetical protein
MPTYQGHCLCGALIFAVEVSKQEIDACHCGMCRRWHGGPALAVMADSAPAFADERALGAYRSSERAERCFCKNCGGAVLWRSLDGQFHAVPAGTLDGIDDFPFTTEIFVDEQPRHYAFAGERTRMTGAEVMAAFGGDGAEGD